MFKAQESGQGYTDDHVLTVLCGVGEKTTVIDVREDRCASQSQRGFLCRAGQQKSGSTVVRQKPFPVFQEKQTKKHNGTRFCVCHCPKKHCAPIGLWVLQLCHIYFKILFRGSWTSEPSFVDIQCHTILQIQLFEVPSLMLRNTLPPVHLLLSYPT